MQFYKTMSWKEKRTDCNIRFNLTATLYTR
jgi:hypothetical protein